MLTRAMDEREYRARQLEISIVNRLTLSGNSIPILDKFKDLWLWDFKLRSFFIEKGVDHFFLDQDPPLNPLPESADDYVSRTQAKFCLSTIQAKVGPNIAPIIFHKTTARAAYNALKEYHCVQCTSKLQDLHERFFTFDKGSRTMLEVSNEVRALMYDLRAAGEVISQQQEWQALTRAVRNDEDYDNLVTVIENLENTNFDDVLNRLSAREMKLKGRKKAANQLSEERALAAHEDGPKQCYTCGRWGHIQPYCEYNARSSQNPNFTFRGRGRGRGRWSNMRSQRPTREEVNHAMAVLNSERVHLAQLVGNLEALKVSTSEDEEKNEELAINVLEDAAFEDAQESAGEGLSYELL